MKLPRAPERVWQYVRRARLPQVLGVYGGLSFAVLQVADIFTERLYLPDWVFIGSLVLLLVGLPVVMATALAQVPRDLSDDGGVSPPVAKPREDPAGDASSTASAGESDAAAGAPRHSPRASAEALSAAGGHEPSDRAPDRRGGPAHHWLTWRRALLFGVLGFGSLTLAAVGFSAMRALGVGPVGSLIAKGVLDERERIVIADFDSQTGDTVLAGAVTEAFRVDFEQSPVVAPVSPVEVQDALRRMDRIAAGPLDAATALELAQREGMKAVVTGNVNAAGRSYVISARLLAADGGAVLASRRENASDSSAIIGAVDRLSKAFRERIGESIRSLRSNEPLAQVTTASLEALKKYSQAARAAEVERDTDKAVALLEEAIAQDSTFAMAYRKLGVVLMNESGVTERAIRALTRAYEHRDRLTDRERYLTMATYYNSVERDRDKAITAYRTLLDIYPDEAAALNNLAILYGTRREHARAEELYRRAIALDSATALRYTNLVIQLVAQGKFEAADSALDAYRRRFPDHVQGYELAAGVEVNRGRYDSARIWIGRIPERARGASQARARGAGTLINLDLLEGRIDAARERFGQVNLLEPDAIGLGGPLDVELAYASVDLLVLQEPVAATQRVDQALRNHPLAELEPQNRPYGGLINFYSRAGRADRARALLAEQVATLTPEQRERLEDQLSFSEAHVARAEGRFEDALRILRRLDAATPCPICTLPHIGLTYRQAGQADSAIAVLERYIETPWLFRLGNDAVMLPPVHEWLAELYEEAGEPGKAALHHARFTELWRNADPVLQPRLAAAQRAAARLAAERTGGSN